MTPNPLILKVAPAPLLVCPKAPPGAQSQVNMVESYVLWGVLAMFLIALFVGVGAIVGGRLFSMPHASKAGVVSLVVIMICAILYFVAPGMLHGMLGTGCV